MGSLNSIDRRELLIGAGALSLAACAGHATNSLLPFGGQDQTFSDMRKADIWGIFEPNGNQIVLPEKAHLFRGAHPFDTCDPTTNPSCPPASPPIIVTVYANAGEDYYAYDLTYEPVTYGLGYGTIGNVIGPHYAHPKINTWACVEAQVQAVLAGLLQMAQILVQRNNIAFYGANAIKAAKYLVLGTISIGEFWSLFVTFCIPGALPTALALVGIGLTIWTIETAIKCHG
jgi:hypothetical protein